MDRECASNAAERAPDWPVCTWSPLQFRTRREGRSGMACDARRGYLERHSAWVDPLSSVLGSCFHWCYRHAWRSSALICTYCTSFLLNMRSSGGPGSSHLQSSDDMICDEEAVASCNGQRFWRSSRPSLSLMSLSILSSRSFSKSGGGGVGLTLSISRSTLACLDPWR